MFKKSVKEIMEAEVISLPPEESVSKALSLMSENSISFIVIASKEQKPLGVITERDILKNYRDKQIGELKTADVMGSPVFTISTDEDVVSAMHTLVLRSVRHLVVVDKEKRICGVLTLTDFLQKLGFEYFVDFKDVEELMDSNPLTLPADADASDVLSSLSRAGASCLIAMEASRPAGIFTERDALRIIQEERDLSAVSLREVMKSPVIYAQEGSCIFEALSMMNKNRIRHLPVINSNGELSGLLSQVDIIKGMETKHTDFMKKIIEEQERTIRENNERLEEKITERTSDLTETNERLQREIKDRKDVEKALRESEEQFKTAFEHAPIGMVCTDGRGRFLQVNPAYCRMLGYSEEELLKLGVADITHPDDRKTSLDYIQNLNDGKLDVLQLEKRYICKDGRIIWGAVSSSAVNDAQGNHFYQLAQIQDISERKLADKAFQTVMETTVGTTGQAFFDITVRSMCDLLGVECAIIGEIESGDHVRALAMQLDDKPVEGHEYDLPGTPCSNVAAKGYCAYPERVCELFPDNKSLAEMKAEAYVGVPLRDQQGEAVGVLCVISRHKLSLPPKTQEIFELIAVKAAAEIERKQAEAALIESETRFRGVFESKMIGNLFWNANGDITEANDAFLEMVGYTRDELLSGAVRWADMTPPEFKEQDERALQEIADTGTMTPIEKENIRKDGTRIPILAGATSMPGPALNGAAFAIDITDRKRAEQALRESEEKYSTLIEGANDGIVIVQDMQFKFCNRAMADITGYSLDELQGMNFLTPIDAEFRKVISERYQQRLAGEYPPDQYRVRFVCKNGALKEIEASSIRRSSYEGRAAITVIYRDITEQKRVQDEAIQLLTENRRLSRQLMQSQEDERRYIARELHDELGQSLTAINTASRLISLRSKEEGVIDKANEIGQLTSKLFKDIRSMLVTLRPPMLDSVGLSAALKNMIAHWKVSTDIDCTLSILGSPDDFPDVVNIAIYRVLQECLTNISRHSEADQVEVSLCRISLEGGSDQLEELLQLDVRDNGQGMNPGSPDTMGLGMVGMRERINALYGSCIFNSSPGKGMHVSVMIPMTMDGCEE